jgi:two-component system CheB/CheR fusion protein
VIDVSLNATAVRDAAGNIVSSRSVWRNITERKLIEYELRQAIKQRERFLAILSHELRNPLNALYNATAILNSGGIDAETDSKTRQLIERQTAHMARLLDDLLDVSRITQNKLELRKQTVDIVGILNDAIAVMQPLFDHQHIALHLDIQENAGRSLRLHGDAVRLQQVYTNLLTNAVKYSDANSSVRLSLVREDDAAVISVHDEGVGIEADILAHIFDLFVQSDNTLDRSSGGMGVGLTLVKLIVEMHDGTVTARSEGRNKGSEFIIRLPLDNTIDDEITTSTARTATAPVKVLIVEDIEDSRVALKMLLELKGYNVSTAADGRQGLELVERERPDIALIDIGLPLMNGYDLASHVSSSAGKPATYLVAVTGYGQPADVEQAYASGFADHIVKPLDTEKLTGLFDKWRHSR